MKSDRLLPSSLRAALLGALVFFVFGGRLAWATPVQTEPPIVVSEETLQKVQ